MISLLFAVQRKHDNCPLTTAKQVWKAISDAAFFLDTDNYSKTQPVWRLRRVYYCQIPTIIATHGFKTKHSRRQKMCWMFWDRSWDDVGIKTWDARSSQMKLTLKHWRAQCGSLLTVTTAGNTQLPLDQAVFVFYSTKQNRGADIILIIIIIIIIIVLWAGHWLRPIGDEKHQYSKNDKHWPGQ